MKDLIITPKDRIDALRLMKRNPDVLDKDDDDEIKAELQGTVAMFLALKRSGDVTQDADFAEWYATADISQYAEDDADPTG